MSSVVSSYFNISFEVFHFIDNISTVDRANSQMGNAWVKIFQNTICARKKHQSSEVSPLFPLCKPSC